ERDRARSHEHVGHGHLLGAGYRLLQLLAQLHRLVHARFDGHVEVGDRGFGLGHALGDGRLHAGRLDDLDLRARGRRWTFRTASLAACAAARGREHVLLHDAPVRAGARDGAQVDAPLVRRPLCERGGFDVLRGFTVLPTAWGGRRGGAAPGGGCRFRSLVIGGPFRHRLGLWLRLLLWLSLCLVLWLGLWRWRFLLSRFRGAARADARDRRADLGRHTLLDDDLERAVGLGLEVEGRLVGLDLGEHVALVHLVAARLLPLDDRALLHRVGELRHIYFRHLGVPLTLAHRSPHEALDVLRGRDRRLLQRKAVRHRNLRAAEAQDGRVQVVEAALLDARGELGGGAVGRPALFDHHRTRRALNRLDDRIPVDGLNGAQVDAIGVYVFLLHLICVCLGLHRYE